MPSLCQSADGAIAIEDFWAYAPKHCYVYMPTREYWPAESVNSVLPPVVLYDADGIPFKHAGKAIKIKP
jgi:hypothetical protein